MQLIHSTSGDVTADRRADYARLLADGSDLAAAVELMEQALEVVADWAAGWFRLGEYREKAQVRQAAAEAYRQTLRLDPRDVFGARLKLALRGDEKAPDRPSSRYVESLFDDYADRFDAALVGKLHYSVPPKLAGLVAERGPFSLTVDLGCGTGLMGAEIRSLTRRLEGFDLSANMLAKAKQKALYDHLAQTDLSLAGYEAGLFGPGLPRQRADLVTAADMMMYLGSLETVFPLVRDLLAPGGFFAFSVEHAGETKGFLLRETLRYAHSEDYVAEILQRHGLQPLETRHTEIRLDHGQPVYGMLFLSRKPF